MDSSDNQVQTRDIPEVEDSNPHLNACTKCIHVKTCGAFEAFSSVLQEMEQKYDYVKKPFPAESLAITCTEYKPLILEDGQKPKIQEFGV